MALQKRWLQIEGLNDNGSNFEDEFITDVFTSKIQVVYQGYFGRSDYKVGYAINNKYMHKCSNFDHISPGLATNFIEYDCFVFAGETDALVCWDNYNLESIKLLTRIKEEMTYPKCLFTLGRLSDLLNNNISIELQYGIESYITLSKWLNIIKSNNNLINKQIKQILKNREIWASL